MIPPSIHCEFSPGHFSLVRFGCFHRSIKSLKGLWGSLLL